MKGKGEAADNAGRDGSLLFSRHVPIDPDIEQLLSGRSGSRTRPSSSSSSRDISIFLSCCLFFFVLFSVFLLTNFAALFPTLSMPYSCHSSASGGKTKEGTASQLVEPCRSSCSFSFSEKRISIFFPCPLLFVHGSVFVPIRFSSSVSLPYVLVTDCKIRQ